MSEIGAAARLRSAERRWAAACATRPWAVRAGWVAAALAARWAFSAFCAAASGLGARDLALFYDGHLYLLIARTAPRLYAGADWPLGTFVDARTLTAWFPLYPLATRAAAAALGDLLSASLWVSHAAGAAAVAITYELACGRSRRPWAAAAALILFPPSWLVAGSFALPEPMLTAAFAGAVLACLRGRRGWAVALAAAACVSQKQGILVVPVLWAAEALERPGGRARYLPYLAALLPLLALQGWLWACFGDPLTNLTAHRETFGGAYFSWPGWAWLKSASRAWAFPLKTSLLIMIPVAASAPAYALACWRLSRSRRTEVFAAWGAIALAAAQCLGGGSAALVQPRLMHQAAPVLAMGLTEFIPEEWPSSPWVLAAAAISAALALANFRFALELGARAASPAYFRAVKRLLLSPRR